MRLPKLNVKLLNRIKRHIKADPRRYDQGEWGVTVKGEDAPACHTQGCIAGWAVFLSVPKTRWSYWKKQPGGWLELNGQGIKGMAQKAQDLLGLTPSEAVHLFRADNQEFTAGDEGVEEAGRKIDDLIADRTTFVTKW